MTINYANPHPIELGKGDALLIIDLQNDLLPGGCLAVLNGNLVIPILNAYINRFLVCQLPIFASRDWHPANHCSFIRQGGPWPPHCVAHSKGAEFSPDLHLPVSTFIISKGTDNQHNGYSVFENQPFKNTLRQLAISRLFIGGLATEYCVLHTVCDALNHRYTVMLLTDAIQAVNVRRLDGENAINEMVQKGSVPITLARINPCPTAPC